MVVDDVGGCCSCSGERLHRMCVESFLAKACVAHQLVHAMSRGRTRSPCLRRARRPRLEVVRRCTRCWLGTIHVRTTWSFVVGLVWKCETITSTCPLCDDDPPDITTSYHRFARRSGSYSYLGLADRGAGGTLWQQLTQGTRLMSFDDRLFRHYDFLTYLGVQSLDELDYLEEGVVLAQLSVVELRMLQRLRRILLILRP